MFDIIRKTYQSIFNSARREFDYFISLLKTKRLRKKQFLLEEGEVCKFGMFCQ